MKTYTVTDLKVRPFYAGWVTDRKEIEANTPIEAVKKYLKSLGLENFKVKRNYNGNGRCFVGKYGYDVICQ